MAIRGFVKTVRFEKVRKQTKLKMNNKTRRQAQKKYSSKKSYFPGMDYKKADNSYIRRPNKKINGV